MDDLDSYLEGELADINDMFAEFQTKDKKFEQRLKTEEKELEKVQLKANNEVNNKTSFKLYVLSNKIPIRL